MKRMFVFLPLLCLGMTACSADMNKSSNSAELVENASSKKPNIVLFFVDDLGFGDLGMKNPVLETPNVDALAAESLSLQNTYVASPTCSPSRATLLTGQHPAKLKMVRHLPSGIPTEPVHYWKTDPAQFPVPNWLDTKYKSYATAIKEQGYYNHFVGKWHLGHNKGFHPTDHGFDSQWGTTNEGHPKGYSGKFFKDVSMLTQPSEQALTESKSDKYLTDLLAQHSVDWINSYNKDQPFMLSLWFYNVHRPSQGKPDYVKHFEEKGLTGDMAKYAAQIKSMDDAVGQIRAALKAKGLDKDTIILFTSDQGSFFPNLPFRGKKRGETLYEGGARVPFFVHWPNVTHDGTINHSLIQTTDIFPTLVDIAGGNSTLDKNLDGVSLLNVIRDNKVLERNKPIYGYRAYEDLYVSVREGNWKLLGYRSGERRLYNLGIDPLEQNNVVAHYPKIVNSMTVKLQAWEKEMGVEKYTGFPKPSK